MIQFSENYYETFLLNSASQWNYRGELCLNETYSKVCIGKHLSDAFTIQNVWNKEMLYRNCFSTLL
jgi:hypothetical protein